MKYAHLLQDFHNLKNRDETRGYYQTDKETAHRYGIYYEWIFNAHAFKLGRPLRIFEVGIAHWHPNSMNVFCDLPTTKDYVAIDYRYYQFPDEIPANAKIYDYTEAYNHEAITLLQKHEEPFDILIDDGSHKIEDQLFFLKYYRQLAAEDALLIVEDIANIDTNISIFKTKYPDIFVIDNRFNGYQSDSVLLIHGIPTLTKIYEYELEKQAMNNKELAQKYGVPQTDPEFKYFIWRASKGVHFSEIYGRFFGNLEKVYDKKTQAEAAKENA